MSRFELFRVRVERPDQRTIDEPDLTPAQLIEHALNEQPSASLRGDIEWHVGNLRRLNDTGLYFRLGKATRGVHPVFDDDSGDFLDIERQEAPYTHCVIDVHLQVCAIMYKSQLAGYTPDLAARLQAALNTASTVRNYGFEFIVLAINDPEEFVEQVEGAHKVKMFGMTFRRPNPWDSTQTREAFERWLDSLDANEGKATARGEELNKDNVVADANAASAGGDEAYAAIQPEEGDRVVRRHSRGNLASFVIDEFEEVMAREALELLRDTYMRIRERADRG